MERPSFKIEEFEGPLDVLLHLISTHKMQLYDIRIYELIDQYLAFIGELGPDALEPTSAFIEMAARLVYMKSVALLPRQEEQEELEKELTGRLIEYHLCKKMAARLRDMSEGINFFVREPMHIDLPNDYTLTHAPNALLEAYLAIMGKGVRLRAPGTEDFDPLVTAPVVSVSSRVVYILRNLRRGTVKHISGFFENSKSRSETVATFLGVLELIKAKRITVADDGAVAFAEKTRTEKNNEHETV